jgi:ATP-dependent Clp protease ATP-binding subunit ClpC
MRLPIELVSQSLGSERNARLLKLDGFLRSRLVGQDEAIARVARRLQLAHAGLAERNGPLAVFLFLGPSGVGKTEMARLLAEFLFGGRSDLTRFDMSEYMEEHSVSKLIGSPPGYVGHDEEGQLTSKLRSRPYSVVLLDEAEKAHPRVFDLFLQLFDAGRLTDAKGRTVDATSAIFVMTSNLGAAAREKLGFAGGESLPPQAPALEEARRWFRPEFLNRIDEQIVFRQLGKDDAARILDPMLEALSRSVEEQHGSKLVFTPEAAAFLVTQGFNASSGARGLERAVERHVQGPLSGLMLSGKLTRSAEWRVVYDEGGIYLLPE